jgi:hypothetical protein
MCIGWCVSELGSTARTTQRKGKDLVVKIEHDKTSRPATLTSFHVPSALVCLSSQPEIMRTTAGIALSACSNDMMIDYFGWLGVDG